MIKIILICIFLMGFTISAQPSPYTYQAMIIDVYDGDTFTALIDLGFHVTIQEKIRLYGVDTPELRGSERTKGIEVRDYVRSLILDKPVLLQTIKDKKGKYGRYLGLVIFETDTAFVDLSEHLLTMKMAKIYD